MQEYHFLINEELDGERIDKALNLLIESLSRSFISKLIKENQVTVNGKTVKSSYSLKTDDEVVFCLPPSIQPDIQPENIPLDILYEDKDVIIINKPKGMVVHPAAGHYSGTLVNALMYHCGEDLSGINGIMRPGIVHRIDMNTTGSIIVCKNDKAHNCIAEQLKEHSITRKYHAICYGVIKDDEGNTIQYYSLGDAIEDCQEGQTIQIIRNVNLREKIEILEESSNEEKDLFKSTYKDKLNEEKEI